MFKQPTVNQIASTYKGNPAPLNAKVEADKKQNGGIPQDLRQLMAAYDLSQGSKNMGIQQALQIPTNMPTVAQSVQERARQALQALMMQQAQAKQPNMVPPGTPRPPMQAQGLDSLESNVGEEYAEGGIIGFSNGGNMPSPEEFEGLNNPSSEQEAKNEVRAEGKNRTKEISSAYKKLTEMMNQDPEAKAQELRDRYNKEVGARDLSIFDKTTAELEARKQKLNAPAKGFDATMEFLEQIALGGGRSSFESGALGSARQRKLQLDREGKQNDLMDKILDLGAKKSEAQFAEKKNMFDMTSKERDEVFKKAFDAAKSVNASDDEAKKIAAQAVENEKNRQNNIRAAQIGAQDRDNLMSRARALMAADPTKKMTLEQAMQRAGEIGNAGQMESAEVRRLAAFNTAKDKIDSKPQYIGMLLDKKNDPKFAQLRQQYADEVRQARTDAGLSASGLNALPGAASSGTVPPPPGYRVN
jgi:hypothetical protein